MTIQTTTIQTTMTIKPTNDNTNNKKPVTIQTTKNK